MYVLCEIEEGGIKKYKLMKLPANIIGVYNNKGELQNITGGIANENRLINNITLNPLEDFVIEDVGDPV
jgi:hypothetical protein